MTDTGAYASILVDFSQKMVVYVAQNSLTKTNRQPFLDLVKVLAILLVLIFHGTLFDYDVLHNKTGVVYFRYWLRTFLSPCVALFFFANGYLLLSHSFHLKKHIFKTLKIVVLVLCWGFLGQVLLMPVTGTYFTMAELIEGICSLRDGWINHLWFLCTLVRIYLLFPLIKYAYDHNKTLFYYITAVFLIVSVGFVTLRQGVEIVSAFLRRDFAFFLPADFLAQFHSFTSDGYAYAYFCLGGLAALEKDRIMKMGAKIRIALPIVTLLVSSTGLWFVGLFYTRVIGQNWEVVWYGYNTIFTLLNTCAMVCLCLNYQTDGKRIRLISDNTLGIYLIHPVVNVIGKACLPVSLPPYNTVPGTIAFAVGMLFVSLALTLLLKKIPLLRRLVTL